MPLTGRRDWRLSSYNHEFRFQSSEAVKIFGSRRSTRKGDIEREVEVRCR